MSENNNNERIINQQDLTKFPFIRINKENNINNINKDYISRIDSNKKLLEQRIKATTMFENGCRQKDIASQLNVTASTVNNWVFFKDFYKKELNLLNSGNKNKSITSNSTKSTFTEAIEMYQNGEKLKEISLKLNISYSRLKSWITYKNYYQEKLTSTCQQDFRTKLNEKIEAINMFENGSKISEIALKFNKTYSTIKIWIKSKFAYRYEIPYNVVEAIKMYKNGRAIEMAAFKCQTSCALIRYWLRHEENQGKNNAEANPDVSIRVSNNANDRKFYHTSVNLNSKLEAVEMFENGKTLKYIASQFNVGKSTVRYWVKCKNNLEKLQKNKTLIENSNIKNKPLNLKTSKTKIFLNVNKKLEAIEMYLKGTKINDIAAQFNVYKYSL